MTKRLRSRFVSVGIRIGMVLIFTACGGGSHPSEPVATAPGSGSVASSPGAAAGEIEGLFEVEEGRSLFLRCTGEGSPTVILEGGDGDTTTSYGFAELTLAAETRTCVYDRANLGMDDPAPGPRDFDDLVGDLESLLRRAGVEPPYVLVGTSGGGYISAGYAYRHAGDIGGMVFIDTGAPFRNPPPPVVQATTSNDPSNVELRDYLQVEKDGVDGRQEIGDIPVSVVTVKYSPSDIAAALFASERAGMRDDVEDQQGWFVLSPRAEQIVVHTGHAVEEEDPQLVIDVILGVVEAARQQA